MFQTDKYKREDRDFFYKFIQENPFATFITARENIVATHIPILIHRDTEEFVLFGHISNENEQLKDIIENEQALLIFKGPDSYVSSSWYKEKDISTWDYSAVHINCRLQLQTQPELISSLQKLVFEFESKQSKPLYYEDLPEKLLEDHLPQITGFWLYPDKIQGISKLHQGFKKEDIINITKQLDNSDSCESRQVSKQLKKIHGTDYR